MIGFLSKRLAQSLLVMLIMSALVFVAVFAIGNPVDVLIDPRATQAEINAAMKALGLDQPFWMQYKTFLANLVKGDVGNSWVYNESALKIMMQRLPATLELAISALVIAIVVGIPLGAYAGLKPDTPSARFIMGSSILSFSVPAFWVGLMLIVIFGVKLHWLPIAGRGETISVFGIPFSFLTLDGLSHLILPAFTLSLSRIGMVIRLVRSGVREVLGQDYIKFARAKGLKESRIVRVHVLKNALIPVITVMGADFAGLLTFAVVTETVFAWPGMGKLIIDSIAMLDRPMIVAYLMVTVLIFILVNFIVDVLYAVIDPRISLTGAKS
ncbi:MAG: ABC transporter permease [Robiginitomaculum sp.]|nr:MAG: ABC transporter permease [Robiginitomaculum sp.]